MESYDVAIVGAGQASTPLAKALAAAGRRVAVVERKNVGGSCVNFGCTPTKAAFASARVAHLARRAGEFGIEVADVRADLAAVLARAESLVERSRHSLEAALEGTADLRLHRGHARFMARANGRFQLAVGDERIEAAHVVLDTGTRSFVPAIPGLADIDYLSAENWLEHRQLPAHLAIVGGGYIGLEMAQFYRRMGAAVTVVESGAQVAGQEDADVAAALQGMLEGEGVAFRTGTRVTRVEEDRHDRIRLLLERDGKSETLAASDVFVAVGRKPNTDDLGLEAIGLVPAEGGTLTVDRRLSTEVPGVWAVGDIRGGPMFTHTAWDDSRILESQLVGDGSRIAERIVPYAVFTDPELGRVGMTEAQARAGGRRIKVARFDMRRNGKAMELGESGGFIKVVADADSDRLLGAAVFSVEGAELVHLYVGLMNADAPYTVMERAIHIHPTLAEAVQSAVAALR